MQTDAAALRRAFTICGLSASFRIDMVDAAGTMAQRSSMGLNPEQKKLLSRIASRLLNLRSGTPISYTRKNLGPQRTLLDGMLNANLIRIVGGQYLPTFRGIDQLDDDIRHLVRSNLNCVLAALKHLYNQSDEYTFNFPAIVEETKKQDPTRDEKDVLPALLLGEEFNYYSFQNGIQEAEDQLVVRSATVVERILDFSSVDDDWAQLIAREEMDRSRRLKMAGQVVGSISASQTQEVVPPNLHFMRHAGLRKIVERDYDELQRVKAVGVFKSRYVLCGGLIEALLLDALLCDEGKAKAANKSPKVKGGSQTKPLLDWSLGELIDVGLELQVIDVHATQFSHGVRNYRNLIHPGKEIQSQQKVAEEEAEIAEKVLEIIIRELCQRRQP